MQKPRLIFLGNTKYSVIDAEALYKHFGLSAVVTISDRTNRDKETIMSPVKQFALDHTIPVIEAEEFTKDIVEKIKALNPDFLVVADYGLILPKSLLSVPTRAAINVHHSMLPKYRGPTPAPAAILNGDKTTGVSIITMTDKVDAGDILKQVPYTLKPDETTDSLLIELNTLGSNAAVTVINEYLAGTVRPKKQDETKATNTSYLTKKDGLINLSDDPALNWRKIRAYASSIGTYFIAERAGKPIPVKIKSASFSDGKLSIARIVPAGKREMDFEDFLRGTNR